MMPLFRTSFEVEGLAPYRALDKLAKRGISVFGVQKLSPTRLKMRVKSKEMQKVFAIFSGSCYTVTKVRRESFSRLRAALLRRPGAAAAALVFLLVAAFGSALVFRVEVVGSAAYRRDAAEACLSRAGVRLFLPYDAAAADRAERELLALPGIVFAEVKKSGTVVTVTLEEEESTPPPSYARSLYAPCAGRVEEIVALRGTPLVKAGDEVSEGQELVGGFYVTEDEQTAQTFSVARCSIIASVTGEYASPERSPQALRDAVAALSLRAGGEVLSSQVQVRAEGEGFVYEVTLRVRVRCSVNL